MTQMTRKTFKKPGQIEKMTRDEKLTYREKTRVMREHARNELATNLTLTDKQKLEHVIDYIVGVPLE